MSATGCPTGPPPDGITGPRTRQAGLTSPSIAGLAQDALAGPNARTAVITW